MPRLLSSASVQRQLAQALAGEREDRVRDRRRDRRHAGSPTPPDLLRARHDVHLDLRHLVHAQHRVVVEVRLLHAPVLEGELAVQRRAEAEGDAGLDLRRDRRRG